MTPIYIVLALKIVGLIGATLNTLGFISFFFFESLYPYRWWLIGIGIVLTLLPELISRFVLKRFIARVETETE